MSAAIKPRGTLRVLFVEDSPDDATLIVRQLERAGYQVEYRRVDTRESFEEAITTHDWDVVISDHSMPHFSSMDALAAIHRTGGDAPFIIVSGTIGEDAAVAAMRAGAHDYVLKDNLNRLAPAIEREIADAQLRRQAREEREVRRAIELQLQHAQKMEAVGRLAGGIAHDFNNLLTAILGFNGLALDKVEEGADVRYELQQVQEAAQRAGRFTRQLLTFSRQQVVSPRLLDPVEAIESITPMLRRLMGEDVVIETSGEAGAIHIRVDPGHFEQVVMNLAVNARDAMPRGGMLRLSTSAVDLGEREAARLQLPPGRYAVITAADTGTGMDEAVRARIFEPFFTTKQVSQGTGLGLSTVYGIIQQSGGAIEVDSVLTVGTTFTLYLPRAAATRQTPPPAPRRLVPGRLQGTVLVAEDDPAVRSLVRTVLTDAGFRVLEAATGTEAADLIDQLTEPVDLLITDIVMRGMIGPEVAQRLALRFPTARVLYMTGYATHPAMPPEFLQEGETLLQKPFEREHLLMRVRERLGLSS